MSPRSWIVRTFALVSIALVAGCGGRGPESGAAGEDVRTLVFARPQDSVGLDPAREDDGESFKVTGNIYDTLVRFQQESTELEPALAESWEVLDGGETLLFHLREGVRFHDGSPFDAEAVVFSLERQRDPEHPFHDAGAPYKYWQAMGMSEIVERVEAVDERTVRIRLTRPEAPILANLAMDFASIVSPEAVRRWGGDFPSHPVGTGPFRFGSWERRQSIVLEANADWWEGEPGLDRLVFQVIPEATARLLSFQQGLVDGFDFPNPFELERIRALENARLHTQPGMNVAYVAMNTQKPPFDDVRVRRAMNMAVDKESIVRELYQGLGTPASNPLPPLVWGYNEDLEAWPYDPKEARRLLAEAGYPDGFETTLWVMSNPRPYILTPTKVAEAILSDLGAIGVDASIVTYEWGTYLDKTDHGEHDMAILGWSGDNGDPDNFLYILLDKTAARPPATNIAFWKDDPYHELVASAKVEPDHERRVDLYRRAQERFHDQVPWIPLAHTDQVVVMGEHVRGFHLHPTTKKDFRGVTVEP